MVVGKLPFDGEDNHTVIDKIQNHSFKIPADIELSDELKDILYRMLRKDFNKRINSNDILEHPFLNDQISFQ